MQLLLPLLFSQSTNPRSGSAMTILKALKPFKDGKVPSEQIKDFHKRFACPFCLHRREHNRAAESARPAGWHHLAQCPHKPAGHTITFNREHMVADRNSASGFAPVSRSDPPASSSRPVATARRAAAPSAPAETPAPASGPASPSAGPDGKCLPAPCLVAPKTVPTQSCLRPQRLGRLSPKPASPSAVTRADSPSRVSFGSPVVTGVRQIDVASPPLSSFNINEPPLTPPIDPTTHVIRPFVASDGSPQPLPCRFVDQSSPRDPNDHLCVDSGTTFSMSGVRSDFLFLARLSRVQKRPRR